MFLTLSYFKCTKDNYNQYRIKKFKKKINFKIMCKKFGELQNQGAQIYSSIIGQKYNPCSNQITIYLSTAFVR